MNAHFHEHVSMNQANRAILSRWEQLDLPDSWLVAGCLFQTIWNIQSGRPPDAGIKDYDLFYFDPSDLSESAESQVQEQVAALFSDLGVVVEVANQARVHLWYPKHFGKPYQALTCSEDGVRRFLVMETCVGVRPNRCLTPFGLEGLYRGTLTPNAAIPYAELFRQKAESYCQRWDWLSVQREH